MPHAPSQPPAPAPTHRPFGLALLAILAVMGGAFDVLGAIVLLDTGAVIRSTTAFNGGLATLLGLVLLVVAFLLLALAYGLWQMRPWAWSLGVGLELTNIAVGLLRMASGREYVQGVLISILLAGTVLFYLYQPPVRALFRRS